MSYKIPLSKTNLTKKDFIEVQKCFNSTWISSKSSWVDKFEKAFATKISKTKYAISVNSGTSALFLALKSLNIGEGDEVIVPAFTMMATVNAIIWAGAKPVLVDCKSFDDFNMDVEQVERRITSKTKAIMPVHIYGYSCEMDKLIKIAKEKKISVIEDAAEAMGSTYKNKVLGSFGDLSCFSLYSNKIITTGNGGMIATNNKKLYEYLKKIRFFDFNTKPHFVYNTFGYNLVLSGLQASLGLSQVKRFDKLLKRRREVFNWYKQYLKKNKKSKLVFPQKEQNPNYWFPAIIFSDAKIKDKIGEYLEENGIETRIFFCPAQLQPIYQEMFLKEKLPISEYFYNHGLLLPSFFNLKRGEVKQIANLINKFFLEE